MKVVDAVERVLLGEPLTDIAKSHREELIFAAGMAPKDAPPTKFRAETQAFMGGLCRQLGERHADDSRAAAALYDWVRVVEDYDAFDALLSGFQFEGRALVLRRGRYLFPGPLTAHWME